MVYRGAVRTVLAMLVAAVAVGAPGQSKPSLRPAPRVRGVPGEQVRFRSVVLDREFRSEGVAVADVNRDGRPDVLAGSLWYEAPDWTAHELAPVKRHDGATGYSDCFVAHAFDVDKDGWPDQVVVGFPGAPAIWRQNPRGKPGHWKERVLARGAGNESPHFADLLGQGKVVGVFPDERKCMAWFEPAADPEAPFVVHTVGAAGASGSQQFSHGMGVGDVNGDGRNDVLTPEGWYEAPVDRRTGPWTFVPAALGPACAHMVVTDVNGDRLPDVVTSSAHDRGIWWFERKPGAGPPQFVQHTIDATISQTHALILADINGDGKMDLVTGKRFWAHGPSGDVGPGEPAVMVWYERRGAGTGTTWVRRVFDEDSGVGTQFCVTDINRDGRLDVVTSNKKGVRVFTQERASAVQSR